MDDGLYVPAAARNAHGRGAERRRGASALLQSVISALSVASGPASVRERFEQELRSMVRARAVAVCEGSSAQQPAGNVMVFDIPSVVLAQGARIEIVFDPGRTLDGWTCELLEAATHVAALVLGIERALGRPPQFARIRRDGARPSSGPAGPSVRCASASSGSLSPISQFSSKAKVGRARSSSRAKYMI